MCKTRATFQLLESVLRSGKSCAGWAEAPGAVPASGALLASGAIHSTAERIVRSVSSLKLALLVLSSLLGCTVNTLQRISQPGLYQGAVPYRKMLARGKL